MLLCTLILYSIYDRIVDLQLFQCVLCFLVKDIMWRRSGVMAMGRCHMCIHIIVGPNVLQLLSPFSGALTFMGFLLAPRGDSDDMCIYMQTSVD